MANDDKPLTQTSKVGVFDEFFGTLKSDKSVSLEDMDNAIKNSASYRLGGAEPFDVPDNFDDIELSDFKDSDDYPK